MPSNTKYPPGAQAALLVWADALLSSSGFSRPPIKNAQELYDGAVFSQLLEAMDTDYNPTELQKNLASSADELRGRRRNLHIIHLALNSFARRECPRVQPLIGDVNFQALDKEPTKDGACQILAVFMCASYWAEDGRHMAVFQQIPESHLKWLFQLIQGAQKRIDDADAPGEAGNDSLPAGGADADDDLAHEALIADLKREVDRWKNENADLITRLDHLQESHDDLVRIHGELQEEKSELEKQLESGARDFHEQAGRKQQIKELETTIWNTEQELFQIKTRKDTLEKEIERLKFAEQQNKDLMDENQILKAEKEEISKKANMADNYKKKLENMRDVEKEVQNLRYERDQLMGSAQRLSELETKVVKYKQSEEAYIKRMHQYEQEVAEFQLLKNQLTTEANSLQLRLREFEVKSGHDEQMIKELQERVMMLDPSAIPEDGLAARASHSLEDELRETSGDVSLRDLEVSRLQAENSLLKSSIGTDTEKGQLAQQITDMEAARQALQEQYNDLFEKHTVGQAQIAALIGNISSKEELVSAMQGALDVHNELSVLTSDYLRNEAYSTLRTQVLAEQNRSKQLEKQLEDAKRQLNDSQRDATEARSDLSAVEKSSQDALKELKNTDGMIAVSLRAELDAMRRKHDALRDEAESQKSQLIRALLDKDQYRREAEDAGRELQKAAAGQPANPEVGKTAEKMEKLRARYKKLQEQYEKSEQKSLDLEKTLKAVRAGTESGAEKSDLERKFKSLQRENALISTAWYDLTSRLQSNHVVLQRRHDVPKSWLNKQRNMVNATPRK